MIRSLMKKTDDGVKVGLAREKWDSLGSVLICSKYYNRLLNNKKFIFL